MDGVVSFPFNQETLPNVYPNLILFKLTLLVLFLLGMGGGEFLFALILQFDDIANNTCHLFFQPSLF